MNTFDTSLTKYSSDNPGHCIVQVKKIWECKFSDQEYFSVERVDSVVRCNNLISNYSIVNVTVFVPER